MINTFPVRLVVYSDLDGTLLDHHTYDWQPALPALERLRERHDWLVLASSKTAAEIMPLRAELGFEHCPAIVENGAGILPPFDDIEFVDTPRDRILSHLNKAPLALREKFVGFSELSRQDIVDRTGLSAKNASLAAKRNYTEPGTFSGTDEELSQFVQFLGKAGIQARRGGRFLTLSEGHNKSQCMAEIVKKYPLIREALVIALGDAPNDFEMLGSAHRGFLIPNPGFGDVEKMIGELPDTVAIADSPGPQGWNACVLSVIQELEN